MWNDIYDELMLKCEQGTLWTGTEFLMCKKLIKVMENGEN